MRTYTTLLIATCLTLGAYTLPGCDEGGSKTQGPRPQTTNTPGAGSTEGSASSSNTPNPHGGDAGSVDATHGSIQPDKASSSPQHPNSITQHQD